MTVSNSNVSERNVAHKPLTLSIFLVAALLCIGILWLSAQPAYANEPQVQVRPTGTYIIYLSAMYKEVTPTPTLTPTKTAVPPTGVNYEAVPVYPYTAPDRVDSQHADLNLDLRGYDLTSALLRLVDYNGSTDTDPPRLASLFSPARVPVFARAYKVYDWIWAPPPNPGTRGGLLNVWPVTLLWMQAADGELIFLPSRSPDIYQGRFNALVLYATSDQITIAYTRDGTVVNGYTIHIVNISVDPSLVALYQQCNAAGRYNLPGLANGQPIGYARAGGFGVAVRDHGTFMDPRSRKDWWPGW